jgi:6,7-dimethyl-8-ribityllumazine synthase
MASEKKNLSSYDDKNLPSAEGMRIGIVVADWNAKITHALYQACLDTLLKHGAKEQDIYTAQVPGAFELPGAAKMLVVHRKLDAVICLGCVIKGETKHNEYISQSVATALTTLGIASSKPCIFGVLTPDNEQQALDRAGGRLGNKGVEAAVAAIRMVDLYRQLSQQEKKIGFR